MALIPPGGDIQVIMLDHEVTVIKDGGTDSEKVLHRFHLGHQQTLWHGMLNLLRSPDLSDEQKFYISFWCGYFYAHDVNGG